MTDATAARAGSSLWIRQTHRWLSAAFTAGFLLNAGVIAAAKPAPPPSWIYFFALVPLFLLLFTGLYLFVLPYATRWRRGRTAPLGGTR